MGGLQHDLWGLRYGNVEETVLVQLLQVALLQRQEM